MVGRLTFRRSAACWVVSRVVWGTTDTAKPALHRVHDLAESEVDLFRKLDLVAWTRPRKEVPWLGKSLTGGLMGGEEVQHRGKLDSPAGKVRLFNDSSARQGNHLNTRKRRRLRLLRLR